MIKVLQLKIILEQTNPVIWRTIQVPEFYPFFYLHNIIQIVMGWKNSHLFEFDYKGYRIAMLMSDIDDFDSRSTLDCQEIMINQIFTQEGDKVNYIYDFGDDWKHSIILEKSMPIDNRKIYPVCIDGEKQCPPEDCGGIHGFYEMLDAFNGDDENSKQEYIDWLGCSFNPEDFNLKTINNQLKDIDGYIDSVWDDE